MTRHEANLLGLSLYLENEEHAIEQPLKYFLNYHLIDIFEKNEMFFSSPLKVVFLNQPIINAFATEGNFIFIYKDLIKYNFHIEKILFILSHEIGHAYLHHVNKSIAYNSNRASPEILLASMGSLLLASPETSTLLMNYLLTENIRLAKKFSQKNELEADEFALKLMQKAGYDTDEMTHYLRDLSATYHEDGKNYQVALQDFSTHPSNTKRIQELQKHAQTLSASKYHVDRKRIHEDFFRLFACFFSPQQWPENQNFEKYMLESYQHRNSEHYWRNLWEKEGKLSGLFQLFYLYQKKQKTELLHQLLETIKNEKIFHMIPEFQDAFYKKEFFELSDCDFIRKYQSLLFLESLDTRPSVIRYLAQAYRRQGMKQMSYFAIAKMHALQGHYEQGLKILEAHSSVKNTPHGTLLYEQLELIKKTFNYK
jgi:hypothetical protein